MPELEVQKFTIWTENQAIFDLEVVDKAKQPVGIDRARLILATDPDDLSTLQWDKPITTSLTADGQVTDGPNGKATFFASPAEVTALDGWKKTTYHLLAVVRKTSDGQDATTSLGQLTARLSVASA